MRKCIIIPDSFKGTMSSQEVCSIIERTIKKHYPHCDAISIPVADGGEGTVDCFLSSMQGEKVYVSVENAFGEEIRCFYGRFDNMAVIEMAAALGTIFSDSEGRNFIPSGGTLADVCTIDNSRTEELLSGVEVCCMCDINNTMYGREGAAYVFAPQKGAAGGMGAGAYVFLGAKLARGIELVLDVVGFDSKLDNCDCVFTGEGRFDSQSLGGKVVVGVAGHAKAHGVPVIAVAGAAEDNIDSGLLQDIGIMRLYTTSKENESMEEIRKNCRDNLSAAMDKIMYELNSVEKPA